MSRLVNEPSSDESDSFPVLDDIEQQTDERASDEDVLYAYVEHRCTGGRAGGLRKARKG